MDLNYTPSDFWLGTALEPPPGEVLNFSVLIGGQLTQTC